MSRRWCSAATTTPSSTKWTASSSTRRGRRSSSRAPPRTRPTHPTQWDSTPIDEPRPPLIISGPAEESTDLYYEVDRIIPKLKRGEVHQGQVKGEDRDRLEASGDYVVDEKNKTVTLTEAGMAKAEQLLAHRLQPGGLYDPANMPLLHHVQQA